MEKMSMCRICLVENVCMYVVGNKSLQELYEKLTGVPFVTEDSRPMLACTFCCTKLKQCWQFQKKCLQAEELFTQMLNEGYKPNRLRTRDHLEVFSGFVKTPIENIDISAIETMAVKEELPVDFERPDDIIMSTEELLRDGIKQEKEDDDYSDVDDIPQHHPVSNLQDHVSFIEVKIEMEDKQDVSQKKQKLKETTGESGVAMKPTIDIRRLKHEDTITEDQTRNEQAHYKVIRNNENRTTEAVIEFKEHITDKKLRVNDRISSALNKNFSNYSCKDEMSNYKSHSDDVNESQTAKRKRFKCDLCPRTFTIKGHLTTHARIHTGEKPYKCEICGCCFNRKGNLTTHARMHTGEKRHSCNICQRSFAQRNTLASHISTHTGEKPYKCDVCGNCYSSTRNLTQHMRKHVVGKPHKCDICQRSFYMKSHLTEHVRTHTGEKPYKCEICQHGFAQKSSLKNHIITHTGEKPFKCEVCGCGFGSKGKLMNHVRMHSGEKPFECDLCQRSFTKKIYLKDHILTHTGERPYKCDVCQRRFFIKRYLRVHLRTHTGETVDNLKKNDNIKKPD